MSQLLPSATTAGDICTAALQECGAIGTGQTASSEDSNKALARLNWMLEQWARKRWMIWHLLDLSITSTGAESYTVGPGGQINTNNVAGWELQSLALAGGGTGYAVNDTIHLSSGGAVLTVLTEAGGVVETFSITTPGSFTGVLPTSFTQLSSSGGGTGATFNTPIWNSLGLLTGSTTTRPDRIEAAYLRQLTQSQPNQIDYPLRLIEAREDYSRIRLKSLVSFPQYAFYDPQWGLGNLFAWPVPQASIYAVHIIVKEQLPSFSSLATTFNLPFEIYEALLYNLAWRLRSLYGIPSFPGDPLPGMAKASMSVVRGANTQIARLGMPDTLQRDGIYNIFSDNFY